MRDCMAAGGPDDAGEYHDGNVSLGHRRLAIIDLSPNGHQPFVSKCGRYVLAYNGEIYNFRELRGELQEKGHAFLSETDTEVLLYALVEWGSRGLERFRGMFAFALFDRQEMSLLLGRDRAGVKPLFFYSDGSLFAFASELKAFHALPSFSKRVDPRARVMFFRYGFVPAPHAIFEGVSKLEPGHLLRVDVREPTRQRLECYWDVREQYSDQKYSLSYDAAVDELERLLVESCKLRMIADVPVGMFLSGGVDSSTVLAVLSRHTSARVKTFTIGFKDADYDESAYARSVAAWFGADHHELILGEAECRSIIPLLPEVWDEPFGDSSQIPTLLVATFARKHVKVSLSADGGDETFYGYPKYWLTESRHRAVARSRWLLKALGLVGERKLQRLGHALGVGDRLGKAVAVASEAGDLVRTMLIGEEVFQPLELCAMLGSADGGAGRDECFGSGKWSITNAVERMLALDYRTYLADDILCKVDRATMAVGLEGREPLLDHKITEFAARLPMAFKHDKSCSKRVLRDVLCRYLPKHLIERKKMGFGVPVGRWMRTDPMLRESLSEMLSPVMLAGSDFRDPELVQTLLNRYLNGARQLSKKVWYLYCYQLWCKKWNVA